MTNENLPKSRSEAKALGIKRYFTGVPCKRGHLAPRTIQGTCLECARIWSAEYLDRPGKREAAIVKAREHYRQNRDRQLALGKKRRVEQGEVRREKQRAWYMANKEAVSQRRKSQRDDEKRDKERAYRYEKYASDPVYAVSARLRSYIANSMAIFGKNGTERPGAKIVLGCTFREFKVHLERQFLPGMSWENRKDWHIDHIVPLATAKTKDDVAALFHHSNLRPMWAAENRAKSDQITHLI